MYVRLTLAYIKWLTSAKRRKGAAKGGKISLLFLYCSASTCFHLLGDFRGRRQSQLAVLGGLDLVWPPLLAPLYSRIGLSAGPPEQWIDFCLLLQGWTDAYRYLFPSIFLTTHQYACPAKIGNFDNHPHSRFSHSHFILKRKKID